MQEQYDQTNQNTIPPPGTVVGTPPQQAKSNKTGWILLIVGVGCLGVLILVAVVGVFFAIYARSAISVPRPVPRARAGGRAMSPVPARSYPYAGNCHRWSTSGLPASDADFKAALLEYVFTSHGKRVTDDLGEINWFKAESNDPADQGEVTVTLSSDAGGKMTLHLSFERDKVSRDWKFTLDKLDAP